MPPITFLVEDNPTIRNALSTTLEDLAAARMAGYAETEEEAIRWLAVNADRWQLAIVDLFLKKGSGIGVLKALEQRSPSQKVVVLSNYATPAMRERCLAAGADRVFDKSTELDDFLTYCQSF